MTTTTLVTLRTNLDNFSVVFNCKHKNEFSGEQHWSNTDLSYRREFKCTLTSSPRKTCRVSTCKVTVLTLKHRLQFVERKFFTERVRFIVCTNKRWFSDHSQRLCSRPSAVSAQTRLTLYFHAKTAPVFGCARYAAK